MVDRGRDLLGERREQPDPPPSTAPPRSYFPLAAALRAGRTAGQVGRTALAPSCVAPLIFLVISTLAIVTTAILALLRLSKILNKDI